MCWGAVLGALCWGAVYWGGLCWGAVCWGACVGEGCVGGLCWGKTGLCVREGCVLGEEALLSGGVHVLGKVVYCSQHNVSLKGCLVYTPVCVLSAEASGPIGTVLP